MSIHSYIEYLLSNETMGWSFELEHTLKDWAIRISRRSTQHMLASRHFQFWSDALMYTAITLTFGSGFVDLIGGYRKNTLDVTRIVSGSLSMFAGIITTIVKFSNLIEVGQKHKVAANDYNILFRKIQLQLATKKKERQPDQDFFAKVIEEFQSAQQASPIVPEKIEHKENRQFEANVRRPPRLFTTMRNQPTPFSPAAEKRVTQTVETNPSSSSTEEKKVKQKVEFWKYPYGGRDVPGPSYIHDNPTGVPMFCSSDTEEIAGKTPLPTEDDTSSDDVSISMYTEPGTRFEDDQNV